MSRWVLGLAVLLSGAACVFAPDLSRFPPCEAQGACPTGMTCLASENLCLPDCGARGPCTSSGTDGGGEPDAGMGQLVLSPNGPGEGAETVGLLYRFQASGGTPPYAFTSIDGLPPGLTLDAQGELSGKPTLAGTFHFTLDVVDHAPTPQRSRQQFSLRIHPVLRVAGPGILADFLSGKPYGEQLSALGGKPPYQFVLTPGSALPPGLVLHDTGQVDGTASGGGSAFEVRVTDSEAPPQAVTRTLQLTLSSSANACLQLCVRTRAAPDARAGDAYAYALQSSGGTGTLTWTLDSGALPPGIQLAPATGLLSGTPTQAGAYGFTVSAVDALGKVPVALSVKVF